jgi:hypothetical protein
MSALARACRRQEKEQQSTGELPDYIKLQVLRHLNDELLKRLKDAEATIRELQGTSEEKILTD